MESRGGDQGCNEPNKVIVHVARVSESGRAGGHDGGHLSQGGGQVTAQVVTVTTLGGGQVTAQVVERSAHQLVDLREGRVGDVQPLSCNAVHGSVVQHNLGACGAVT